MQRIPYPENVAPRSGPNDINVGRIMQLFSPKVLEGFGKLTGGVMFGSPLDGQLREIAILRVGHLSNCAYEVYHHESFAKHAGLTPEKIKATKDQPNAALWSPAEKAVIAFTDDIVRNVRPSDATLTEMRKHLSDTHLMDLIASIGAYMLVCRVLETTGIELDPQPIDPSGNS